jgi:hypothetical protein
MNSTISPRASATDRLPHEPHAGQLRRRRGRAVVDHDHLGLDAAEVLVAQRGERPGEDVPAVAGRDHHGDVRHRTAQATRATGSLS